MQWDKDTFKEARLAAKLSQVALAEELGVHWRTVQNWEMGKTHIPTSVSPALDQLFIECKDVVPKEEYDKVVSALNAATELNKKLSDLLQINLLQQEHKQ
jgi:DNA-binding XRE family transcriptional regulator